VPRAPAPISVDEGPPIAAASRLVEADLGQLRRALLEIKKAIKTALFNRHRTDQFESYIAPAHSLLAGFLEVHGSCELKLEVSTFVVGDAPLFEDDNAESNIIYPLWASGIRLLVFKRGVTGLDLLRFFLAVVEHKKSEAADDLVTWLWKQDFPGIEWVVVADFALEDDADDDGREVEIEVEKVLSFLQDQLRSDSADSIGFARVSVADLDIKLDQLEQMRQTVIARQTVERSDQRSAQQEVLADERDLLRRICNILLEVLKLPATPRELMDLEQAFEQLLDGLILEGQFGMVDRLLTRCEAIALDETLPTANREMARTSADRLYMLMHEGQRVRAVGAALNSGRARDLEGLRRYLLRLGPTVALLLLDLLDTLNAAPHRRLLADVLVSVGEQGVPMFARRLPTASSNLAKDLLYVIDQIDPPDKLQLFAPILQHENAVLRMEGLTTIGRSKTESCFQIIKDVFETHDVPQMRAHAARILAEYPPKWAEPVLLAVAKNARFNERPDGEKRALIGALVKVEAPGAQRWVKELFSEKSGIFSTRADDRKLMAISALMAVPGVPSLQLLVEVAKEERLHSRDVREAAHQAAHEVKRRLLGPNAALAGAGEEVA
jgi:hypothetical protein